MIAPGRTVGRKVASGALGSVVYHGAVAALGFLMLYPLLWMAASSFKPGDEIPIRFDPARASLFSAADGKRL